MQQTETYKFNLIEPSDTFSPDPLNENMEKVEAAIAAGAAAEAEARTAADAALDARVSVLELHKCVVGSYIGNGKDTDVVQFIDLGFTPTAVITADGLCTAVYSVGVRIVPGGFEAFTKMSNTFLAGSNLDGRTYHYIAFR